MHASFQPLVLSTQSPAATQQSETSRAAVETAIARPLATHAPGMAIGEVEGRAHSSPVLSVPAPGPEVLTNLSPAELAMRTAGPALERVPVTFIPRASQYYLQRCTPTEKRVRFAFLLLTATGLFIALLTGVYVTAMLRIRDWIRAKHKLKAAVKQLAGHTSDVVVAATTDALAAAHPAIPPTATGTGTEAAAIGQPDAKLEAVTEPIVHPSAHPLVLAWLGELDAVRLGDDRRGFVFVLDGDGGVWAHSKAHHLVGDARGTRAPGFHNVRDIDSEHDDEQPVARILRHSKKGGGYVHFTWKKDRLMVAFVCPVRNTDLTVGGAILVPHCQTLWERQYAVAAEKRAAARRKGVRPLFRKPPIRR